MAITLSAVAAPATNDASARLKANRPAINKLGFANIETTPEFARFGEWGEQLSVVRDGAIHSMAYQLATHPRRKELSRDALWRACAEQNRASFQQYQIVRLDEPSFFLPRGEVVFKVIHNPIQLPDNPPQGVMMRHLEAMMAHPLAKFYLLEPVFTSEPYYRLYSSEDLRTEATGDQRICEQIAWRLGWAHRGGKWTAERVRELAGLAMRGAAWAIELLATEITPSRIDHPQHADELAALLADDTLNELARRAEQQGLERDAKRLRRAIEELRWRTSIDPVLCFELEERPGELWFEAHWYTGMDGRRYVHY
ncbi:hypothetical protein NG895_20035 [Aeoliella sp. ICT_H6.2]|uniref:Uncharacterized protein n=1 Tax=Aeoliella straminimaris TaxID=2954799 RepID=A0A9X2FDH4_9BACT|nr:hypothetical protein [Aeoliella straminimaris]MCO6046193.1 hypothetical protein [Aeoliella straminimaris]